MKVSKTSGEMAVSPQRRSRRQAGPYRQNADPKGHSADSKSHSVDSESHSAYLESHSADLEGHSAEPEAPPGSDEAEKSQDWSLGGAFSASTPQSQSAIPEPTAVSHHSSQVEGGARSVLDKRDIVRAKARSSAGTGTAPVRLSYAPGMVPPRPTTAGGAWSSLLWPEQRTTQRLTGVPEGVSTETIALTQFPDMTNAEMIEYARTQFEMWMNVPAEVVVPVSIAYQPCQNGSDLWNCIKLAKESEQHWLSVMNWEMILSLPSYTATVVSGLRSQSGEIPDSRIRLEIERVAHYFGLELAAWRAVIGDTPRHVGQPSETLLPASLAPSAETPGDFYTDGDGDVIMDPNVRLFLGDEVVLRFQSTGIRPRSPQSSIEEEPSRKRPLLDRASSSLLAEKCQMQYLRLDHSCFKTTGCSAITLKSPTAGVLHESAVEALSQHRIHLPTRRAVQGSWRR
ncbi:unnamed protein product [Phytophthora lilii]|uniref:Unnamed protein product n=1 Tax=Phytophthora lilii TaxID=2077276 RepID=A0A9W6X4U1_9STRA|nr:unnamed protein product [Phytophthora lilii]